MDALWHKLPSIDEYNKQGYSTLSNVKQFSSTLAKTYVHFANGLRDCSQLLDQEHYREQSGSLEDYNTLEHSLLGAKTSLD